MGERLNEIPLKPGLTIRAGRHRYTVLERGVDRGGRWTERWVCKRCGQITSPNSPFNECMTPEGVTP